jgi:hypothetical protein
MPRRIRNTTDIPRATIEEVISFVVPPGVAGFDIEVKNTPGTYKAKAYPRGSHYHATASAFIVLYLGKADKFPRRPALRDARLTPADVRRMKRSLGYQPPPYLATRLECLVFLAAHELRHLWQAKVKKGHRVWGARGQYSEKDADAYAIRMLRAWRKEH